MRVFLVGVAGLTLLAGAAYMMLRPTSTATKPEKEPTVSTMSVKETTETYEIGVDYPQFGIAAIDEQIRNDVSDAVDEFKTIAPNSPESASGLSGLHGDFSEVYIGPDIVSVQLLMSEYSGGAHDLPYIVGYNFDRATGKRLEVADALALIGKTLAEVSSESIAMLREKFGDDFFAEGASASPENFGTFLVSADKVTFVFRPYQVVAYAAGVQEAEFVRIH